VTGLRAGSGHDGNAVCKSSPVAERSTGAARSGR